MPAFLRRNGEPQDYQALKSVGFLTTGQRRFLDNLPQEFTWKEAVRIHGGNDGNAGRVLKKLKDLGVVEKTAKGQYRKAAAGFEAVAAGSK